MFDDIKIKSEPFFGYCGWNFKYKNGEYGNMVKTNNEILIVKDMLKTMKLLVKNKMKGERKNNE